MAKKSKEEKLASALKRLREKQAGGYISYQKLTPASSLRWEKEQERIRKLSPIERQQLTKKYEKTEAEQIIREVKQQKQKEEWHRRQLQAARFKAEGASIAKEATRIVTSRKPMFRTEAVRQLEGFIATRPKRLRRVRLRYAPMYKNILDAGQEAQWY